MALIHSQAQGRQLISQSNLCIVSPPPAKAAHRPPRRKVRKTGTVPANNRTGTCDTGETTDGPDRALTTLS